MCATAVMVINSGVRVRAVVVVMDNLIYDDDIN